MAKSTWALDPTHSEIGFKVKHMMFTNVSGQFKSFTATIENEDDNFELSDINVSIEAASVDTNNADRDTHLRNTDFFAADVYPKISFVATAIKRKSDGTFQVRGALTIKDVTKEITMESEISGIMKDPWGNTKVGVSVTGKINRKDFGLSWNATLEAGGVLLGEEVKIAAEIQLVKQN